MKKLLPWLPTLVLGVFVIGALLVGWGCASAASPAPTTRADSIPRAEAPVPSAASPCGAAEPRWVHLPVFVHAEPPHPMTVDEGRLLDEVVVMVRSRAPYVTLRVEGHGCHGEAPERTLARAAYVRDRLVERGLPEARLSTTAYPPGQRGCFCPCEVFEDPPHGAEPGASKNCSAGPEVCRQMRDQILRVELSVLVCEPSTAAP